MYEYLFLLVVALIALIFAVVQDVRTTEISDWLNFSLLAVGLSYRGFYSIFNDNVEFFYAGLIGVLLLTCLAYLLYYSGAFAGGDAKLLVALGAFLPFSGVRDIVFYGMFFVFLIFLCGAIWGLGYTVFLVCRNYSVFRKNIFAALSKSRSIFFISAFVGLILGIFFFKFGVAYFLGVLFCFILLPFIYVYAKVVEKHIMVVFTRPDDLIEGDWLERDVKLGTRVISKTVHGLTKEEISLLRKHKKKVWIKNGIPFGPAFLLAFLVSIILLRNFSL